MAASDKTPASPSSAYEATAADRTLILDMIAGLPAIQAKREVYLTKWSRETPESYNDRLREASFTPLFEDLLMGLASKPFSKEVALKDGATDTVKGWCKDIDGEGNNLHVFSETVFANGIRDGLCAIMVDHPVRPKDAKTKKDDEDLKLRPYFVRVDAANLLALYTVMEGGVETITHVRIRERTVKRDGWDEKIEDRVRVLEPGIWELWEENETPVNGKKEWVRVDKGTTTLSYVPLVVFSTGERCSAQHVPPPLTNLARMQRDLFRSEAAAQNVENRGAFMMLAANGMTPPEEGKELVIGPMSVLFGGADGEWVMLEPAGSTLEHFRLKIDAKMTEMRRLGNQPLTPGSAAITATATATEADKSHSLVQKWALRYRDAAQKAFGIACDWIKEAAKPEVFVHTEFAIDMLGGQDDQTLLAMHEQRVISKDTVRTEMKRRGRLSSEYDAAKDDAALTKELEDLMDLMPDVVGSGDEEGTQPAQGTPPGKKPPTAKPAAKKPVPA